MDKNKSKKLPQYKTVKLPIDDGTWNKFVKLIKNRKQFKGGAIVELIENEVANSELTKNNQNTDIHKTV